MDRKTLNKLELDKVLARLAEYAAFSASRELLERLEPTNRLDEARRRQQETSEARLLLEENSQVTVGGARDVRGHVGRAARGIPLLPEHFLEIKATLQAGGALKATIEKVAERFPLLAEIAGALYEGKPVVAAIDRAISEQGEVLDSASPALASIRHELRVQHDRLHSRLQSIIQSSRYAPYLQEAIITQRNGRYVIPLRAEAKGRIKGIVHDQSSSGATVFIEPEVTVEINNRIRELEVAEQTEIERILRELSLLVGEHAEPITWSVEALAQLDAAFAKAKYASTLRAHPPTLVEWDEERFPGSTIKLYNARHPLIDPQQVVPIDAVLDDDTYVLVITGPNTGGKTVTLKTVGLLALMAQCGLHIPAAPESELSVFEAVYADIGDEQSIEQSLSTFSAHMTHIIQILEAANDRSLVLLDELGAGTDPTEGAAIARAILNDLLDRGVTTFVATHYPELKLYAHSTRGVTNASVEFDVKTLRPTYRLIIGLPGRSNAILISQRLGLPEHILDMARSYVGAEDLTADDLLDEIHRAREEALESERRMNRAEHEAQILRDRLQERLDQIEEERQQIVEEARRQAEQELEMVREEVRELRRLIRAIPPSLQRESAAAREKLAEIERDIAALEDVVQEPVRRAAKQVPKSEPREEPREAGELRPGDRVFVPSLNAEGEVLSVGNGEVEVQVGTFRVKVAADSVEFIGRKKKRKPEAERGMSGVKRPQAESPGLELHLIGMTRDEALPRVEEYIDQAYLAGLPWVRIVHGKGSGTLRRAIHDILRGHPLIKDYQSAPGNEGGEGVTVVHFQPTS